jgi:hypothetical protein
MIMLRRAGPHPDQYPLALGADAIEREIERRVTARCEAQATRWRFRLVLIETAMMATLGAAGGFALGQPARFVATSALVVAASCFLTGSLLLGLSLGSGRLLTWLGQRARK